MHYRFFHISGILLALSLAILCAWPTLADPAAPPVSTPVPVEGNYSVKVGGFFQGPGQGSVTGGVLTITASVTDEKGNTGDFTVSNITLDANNRFSGAGTVLGAPITISGRLDPVNEAETQLKTARLTANFSSRDGHRGRVAGYIPVSFLSTVGGSGSSGSGSGGSGSGGSGSGGTGSGAAGTGSTGTGGTGPGNPGTGGAPDPAGGPPGTPGNPISPTSGSPTSPPGTSTPGSPTVTPPVAPPKPPATPTRTDRENNPGRRGNVGEDNRGNRK